MFKKKLLHLNTKSHLKFGKRKPIVGFEKALTIGIVFTSEDLPKHKAIKTFIKSLEDEGKNVQVITYMRKGGENHEFLFDFFSDEDVNFMGSIKNETALKFAENPFDFLFHLDQKRNDLLENIVARSKAKCRIGVYTSESTEDDQFYEVMVHPKDDSTFSELLKEIYHYTRKITGNGD